MISTQPLYVLPGVSEQQLELYPQQVVMRRMDALTKVTLGVFGDSQTIALSDITEVFFKEPTGDDWVHMVIRYADHHHLSMRFNRQHCKTAQAIKQFINEYRAK